MKNLKLTTHFLIAIGLIFSSALIVQSSLNFENRAIENQAGVFDSVKNLFSKSENSLQETENVNQDDLLDLPESEEDFKDQFVNPNLVFVKLYEQEAVNYRQNSRLPEDIQNTLREYGNVKHETLVSPIKDPTHHISHWLIFELASFEDANKFASQMHDAPSIVSVDRDWKQELYFVPQDEFYQDDSPESLWALDMINAQGLWDVIENPGEGVLVGVLDSGVSNTGDPSHPLTHQDLVGSEWINADEIPDNGIDDDANGYVDDYLGGLATNVLSPVFEDYVGHGTHVAGIIAAQANDIGFPGVAYDSTILPFKFPDGGSWGIASSILGIVFVTDHGVDVINNSWGGSYSESIADAVLYAHDQDVVVVSASGNDYGSSVCGVTPAGSEYSFAVSAVNPDGELAEYSNVGTGVDVSAPGGSGGDDGYVSQEKILSTRTLFQDPYIEVPYVLDSQSNKYISINGTSMATPHVSAAAAVIRQQHPGWNNEQVYAALRWITVEQPNTFFAEGFGHGILDVSKIPDLPNIMPVAQLYSPRNCTSYTQQTQGELVEIIASAYVPGAPTPDSVRLEMAQGLEVGDEDFELIVELAEETQNEFTYMLDISDFSFDDYTLRIVTEYDGVTVEDRNRFSVTKGWLLIPFGDGSSMHREPSSSEFGEYFVAFSPEIRFYETSSFGDYENNYETFSSNGFSLDLSYDGRYVAFWSPVDDAVPNDTNEVNDIFVYDRETEETTRVSVDSDGNEGNGSSYEPSISADGRYVAFRSISNNLVSGDSNGVKDIFVYDRETEETTRVSIDSDGVQGNYSSHNPSISSDGRYVSFGSNSDNLVSGDTNEGGDIFVHDRETEETTRVSVGLDGNESNDSSSRPSISSDGRYVAFESDADNLTSGDVNTERDIFVHDRETEETTRVSVDIEGGEGLLQSNRPDISPNGQYVFFDSMSFNFPPYNTINERVFLVKLWEDDPEPQECPWDLNSDGIVNAGDLLLFLGDFGQFVESPADFNNNGIVDSNDLLEMLANFGQLCSQITGGIAPGEPQVISTSNPQITSKSVKIQNNLINPVEIKGTDLSYNYIVEISNNTKNNINDLEMSNLIPETLNIKQAFSDNNAAELNYGSGGVKIKKLKSGERKTTIYLDVELPEDICQKVQNKTLEEYGLCK